METVNYEVYVSLEVAKLLKDAGFDWKQYSFYNSKGILMNGAFAANWNDICYMDGGYSSKVSAPTLEVAQRWLREVKNIRLLVETGPELYIVESYTLAYGYWTPTCLLHDGIEYERFYTYEKALEAGIKKALEIILKEK